MIRKTTLAIALVFIVSGIGFAQVEKQVAAIRVDVAAINKAAKSYKKKTKNVDDISVEGTEATYFSARKDLKKITANMYGETYRATGEFYYKRGELIFAYMKITRYNGEIGMKPFPKVASVNQERYYLSGGEVIRVLLGKKQVKPDDEGYGEMKDQMLNIAKGLKDAY